MKLKYAQLIAWWLRDQRLKEVCQEGRCAIAGGVRREKPDVHDIEIMCVPLPGHPRPEFGKKAVYGSHLDRRLAELEEEGRLRRVKGGEKYKKFEILRLEEFGVEPGPNPFMLDLFIVTPPAQWGVILAIRTGPNSQENNFSQWIVTPKAKGGALPDGFHVKDGAVWRSEDGKLIEMAEEEDFMYFLGLGVLEPRRRVARWGRSPLPGLPPNTSTDLGEGALHE